MRCNRGTVGFTSHHRFNFNGHFYFNIPLIAVPIQFHAMTDSISDSETAFNSDSGTANAPGMKT